MQAVNIEKAYRQSFPKSQILNDIHKCFKNRCMVFQILGQTGAGKSMLCGRFTTDYTPRLKFGSKSKNTQPKTGVVETTSETEVYDITSVYLNYLGLNPDKLHPNVLIADQPGIGGMLQNARTRDYLKIHAPGHYDLSIMMTSTRLIEGEVFILRHLLKHGKPVIVVKSQMDATMNGETRGKMKIDPDFDSTVFSKIYENVDS